MPDEHTCPHCTGYKLPEDDICSEREEEWTDDDGDSWTVADGGEE